MKIIQGNKEKEINEPQLIELSTKFKSVVVDLGTGDGRFAYKMAREDPTALVIGLDPSKKQLENFSKKANKEKLTNILYVIGSIEMLPEELAGVADKVYINFPWGSLLAGIANASGQTIEDVSSLIKPGGGLEIIFGYSQSADPSEVERLGLSDLSAKKVKGEVIPEFERRGFGVVEVQELGKEEVFEISSTWGKKLSFGQKRKIFRLVFNKIKKKLT